MKNFGEFFNDQIEHASCIYFSHTDKTTDAKLTEAVALVRKHNVTAELIVTPSLINLDFADVRTTLKGRGLAHMGIGVAKGEKRIYDAVRCAVCSPLLNTTIEGANAVIINVIGGSDLGLEEVTVAANLVKDVIDYSANVIFGACIDENMADEVEIVIIATGFGNNPNVFTSNAQNEALRQASSLSKRLVKTS